MSRSTSKCFLVIAWVLVVFGYLWLLQFAYEKEKSFYLFVLLAIAGNMAYDGLKTVIRYDPLFPSDGGVIVKYVIGFIFSLFASVGSLLVGAALFHGEFVNEFIGQLIAGIGFLVSIAVGMTLLVKAETGFKLTNKS